MEQITDLEKLHQMVNTAYQNVGGIVFSSSGSTQPSKSLLYSMKVMEGAIRRTKELLGLVPLSPPSKIVILWGYGLFPPAQFYTLALAEMGNWVYPIGSGKNLSSDIAANRIHEISPEVIIGMPSYIIKILDLISKNGWLKDVYNSLKIVITGGEVLTDEYREKIEKEFEAKVYDSYGMLQAPMIAGECSQGRLHISKEYTPEILSENMEISYEGNGELLLSSNQVWYPLEMYRLNTNDKVILSRTKCNCGYETPTIKILGRSNQKLKVRGQIIDFGELIYKLEQKGYEGKYYIEIVRNQTDTMKFCVSNDIDLNKFKKEVDGEIAISYETQVPQEFVMPVTSTGKIKHILIRTL